jgi:uncharacterized protein (DUF924 family)
MLRATTATHLARALTKLYRTPSRTYPPLKARISASMATQSSIKSPIDVLDFWFGDAYSDASKRHLLEDTTFMGKMSGTLWYAGTSADESCMRFVSTIEAAAAGTIETADPAWMAEPDASIAKVILFDQLTRNCFRGTDRAFAYDGAALELSRRLAKDNKLVNELPASVLHFIGSPFLHSENLEDHDMALALNDVTLAKNETAAMYARPHIINHRDIIARFGRYPHRNKAMERDNTEEETAWLESDEVPGWAKSQMK